MRISEWLTIAFSLIFTLLAWLLPLRRARRFQAAAIGAAGISLLWIPGLLEDRLSVVLSSMIRDWLPAPAMLIVYWQSGRFFRRPQAKLQAKLEALDYKVLEPMLQWLHEPGARRWLSACLELAYLLCYPLVPLGVGMLYAVGMRQNVDYYWTMVLLPAYLCYLATAIVNTLPPRVLDSRPAREPHSGKIRALNLWIIRYASIKANTFPSAHVASTMASSLALIRFAPWVGLGFLVVSLSIAAGAVIGRYHYLADAVVAAILSFAVFLLL